MAAITTVQELRDLALLKANDVRSARAKLLNRMYALPPAESHRFAAMLVKDTPPELETLRLGRFLNSVRRRKHPGSGARRRAPSHYAGDALRLMRAVSATDLTRLGDLSAHQREMLISGLRLRAEERES